MNDDTANNPNPLDMDKFLDRAEASLSAPNRGRVFVWIALAQLLFSVICLLQGNLPSVVLAGAFFVASTINFGVSAIIRAMKS